VAVSTEAELDDEIARMEALLERKRTERDRQDALALVPVPRTPTMPCSFQQEGMWFMHRFAPNWSSYHVPVPLRIHGDLDLSALERALHALVVRHEALRTRFVDEGGLPHQVIEPPPTGTLLPVIDLVPDRLVEWGSEVFGRPFDLATGPGYRVAVARLAPDDHAVIMVFHHIVTDGWSATVMAAELSAHYAADRAGQPVEFPPLPLQPADYAAWQRRVLVGPERDRQVGWWRDRLAGLSTVDFPTDRERPARPTGAGSNVTWIIPAGTAAQAYTREHQVSLLAILHAGLLTVLRRYTGQDDLPVGSLMTGRTRSELDPLVGYFGTIVVLRPDLTGDPTFGELVRRCHATVLDAITHQDVPFPFVVDAVRPQRVRGRNPLFQIGLTLNPPAIVNTRIDLGDVSGQSFEIDEEYTLWDMALDVSPAGDGNLYLSIDYSAELFDTERMRRLAEHFGNAIANGLAAPDTAVADVEIMSASEREQVLAPAGNALTYVLDDRLRPAPIGITGQLYVADNTVGQPDPAPRFLPNPYAGRPDARMYATGDLVRRRADGGLDYVGRLNRRVTVRGERINLGRIEAVLAEHPAVDDCCVMWHDESGLIAYVSTMDEVTSGELRSHLSERLPAPLVPGRVVILPALPLTADGRPDTASLAAWPGPARPGTASPRNDLEGWLATTWQRLLGLPEVAGDDNFFDLGGNSLHATQVVAFVRDGLGVDLPVREMFTHQTLGQLAARIAEDVAPIEHDVAPTDHSEELDGHRELSDRAVR